MSQSNTCSRVCVFIPTHIHYKNQFDLLNKCLQSLINQTYRPDIYLSVSFDNEEFKSSFIERIYTPYIQQSVNFKFSKVQKFQMEHLLKLTDLYANNYELVMFCDDDDEYSSNRVDRFLKFFDYAKAPEVNKGMIFGGVKECHDASDMPEYWAYAIVPQILIEFFNRFKAYDNLSLLKFKFSDMYLRNYLRKINKADPKFGYVGIIDETLYLYNDSNPDSICFKIENQTISKAEIITNQLLLTVINQSISMFNQTCKYALSHQKEIIEWITQSNQLSVDQFQLRMKNSNGNFILFVQPEYKQIAQFCEVLYA